MKLFLDTSRATFRVEKVAEPRLDDQGRQRADRRTGELLFSVQVTARDDSGAQVINITVAGEEPKVSVDQIVVPVELEAIPWAQNGRNGVAYRAKTLKPAGSNTAKAAA